MPAQPVKPATRTAYVVTTPVGRGIPARVDIAKSYTRADADRWMADNAKHWPLGFQVDERLEPVPPPPVKP